MRSSASNGTRRHLLLFVLSCTDQQCRDLTHNIVGLLFSMCVKSSSGVYSQSEGEVRLRRRQASVYISLPWSAMAVVPGDKEGLNFKGLVVLSCARSRL